MKTAVFYGGRDIRLEDVPKPEPGAGQALVKIHASGICGSDLHRYRGCDPWADPALGADKAQAAAPYRSGHEFSGTIEALGPDVRGFEIGERVAVEPMQLAGCGRCAACRRGANNLCIDRPPGGLRSAGFSEWDLAGVTHLHRFEHAVDFELAALADVYACAVHALHRLPVAPGAEILIVGTGPVALALGQAARDQGASVMLAGRSPASLARARELGAADEVLSGDGVAAQVMALTDGRGADLAFEVVGGSAGDTLLSALQALAPRGSIGVLGAFEGDVRLPYRLANRKEIQLVWCNGYAEWQGRREFSLALESLVSGQYRGAPMITHRYPLSAIGEAFDTANRKSETGAIKVIIQP